MIIFTKYSNDRRPELAIRTDIIEEGGIRSVVKAAADSRALGHISGLMDSYRGLSKLFEKTRFVPNRCTEGEGFCSFEFLEGSMLEEQMDLLLDKPDELVEALRGYFDELVSAADTEFSQTEEFVRVFGDITTSGTRAFSIANIDMVLNNIIVRDGWNVIDYEWTFRFPVPVNFIIWRVFHYYADVNMKRQFLLERDILPAYGITEDDVEKYRLMEKNFQAYVSGDNMALRDLYPLISPGYVVVGELWEAYREKNEKRTITLFPDKEGAFTPENMILTFSAPHGIYKRTIRLGNSTRLRIDPTESAAIVHVNSLTADGVPLDLSKATVNGLLLGDNDLVFSEEDPWFILNDIPEGSESVEIDMKVMPLDPGYAAAWQKLSSSVKEADRKNLELTKKLEEKDFLMAGMRRSVRLAQSIIDNRNHVIHDLGETKVMRLYRKVRSSRHQSDPIEGLRPSITNDGSEILYNIDSVTAHDCYLLIHGWAIDTLFGNENLQIVDAEGREVKCSILRSYRDDVAGRLKIDPERRPGFEIRIRYSRIASLPLTLRIEDPRGYLEIPVEGINEEEIELGRQGEIVYEAKSGLPMEYDDFMRRHRASHEELRRQRKVHFDYSPSVGFCMPVYNVSNANLRKMIDSLLAQSYRRIEVCIADGSTNNETEKFIRESYGTEEKLHYTKVEANPVTAENLSKAIDLSTSDVIIPVDANDIADPRTAYEIVKCMNETGADVVYTDEDRVTPEGFFYTSPVFKPDYSPDYLRSINYIGSYFAVKREVLSKAGMPDLNFGDAYMYDFIFRCCENAGKVGHVPIALCHRRINPARDVENPDSIEAVYVCEMRAIDAHLKRTGIDGRSVKSSIKGGYHVKAEVKGRPLVSIIIPNRDHMETLRRAIDSIMSRTTYGNFEVIIVENGSTEENTFLYYERIENRYANVKVLTWTQPFNYSAINNFGVAEARGDYLLFLNNDIEVITPDWIEDMLSICQREECGACGARLIFPNNTIQHIGVVIGMGGAAGHMFSGEDAYSPHSNPRSCLTQNLSAATAACLMVKRSAFEEIGGFDENLQVAFNDVDLCLKLREAGYLVAVNASAELYHYESLTRGSDKARDDNAKHERFLRESGTIRSRWEKYFRDGDPYFNPNLDAARGDFAFIGEYPAIANQEKE